MGAGEPRKETEMNSRAAGGGQPRPPPFRVRGSSAAGPQPCGLRQAAGSPGQLRREAAPARGCGGGGVGDVGVQLCPKGVFSSCPAPAVRPLLSAPTATLRLLPLSLPNAARGPGRAGLAVGCGKTWEPLRRGSVGPGSRPSSAPLLRLTEPVLPGGPLPPKPHAKPPREGQATLATLGKQQFALHLGREGEQGSKDPPEPPSQSGGEAQLSLQQVRCRGGAQAAGAVGAVKKAGSGKDRSPESASMAFMAQLSSGQSTKAYPVFTRNWPENGILESLKRLSRSRGLTFSPRLPM